MTSNDSPNEQRAGEESLRSSMLRGAAWMFAMRMAVRFIGLINTVILARILEPEDFGLVAMAMIVLAFVEAMNSLGLDLALVRAKELPYSSYNTAWTIALVISAVNASLLAYSAPFVASFYGDARLEPLLYTMALLPLLYGLQNPRAADFRRQLLFSKDFIHQFASRAIAFPITIVIALVLRNYWALVIGMLVSSGMTLIVGYIMRPFLPRPSLIGYRSLLAFSVWAQVRSVGSVLASRFDQLVIGKNLSAAELGGYRLSQEMAGMTVLETVLPLSRAFMPGYARLQDSSVRRREALLMGVGAYAIMAMGVAGSLLCVSEEFIRLVLGPKWSDFTPIFQILLVSAALSAISNAAIPFLVAVGEIRRVALFTWLELALAVVGFIGVALISAGLIEFALVRVAVSGVMLVVLLRATLIVSKATSRELIKVLARPIVSTVLMMVAIEMWGATVSESDLASMAWKLFVGVLTYTLVLELAWFVAGRPDGIEREINNRLLALIKRSLRWLRDALKRVATDAGR